MNVRLRIRLNVERVVLDRLSQLFNRIILIRPILAWQRWVPAEAFVWDHELSLRQNHDFSQICFVLGSPRVLFDSKGHSVTLHPRRPEVRKGSEGLLGCEKHELNNIGEHCFRLVPKYVCPKLCPRFGLPNSVCPQFVQIFDLQGTNIPSLNVDP